MTFARGSTLFEQIGTQIHSDMNEATDKNVITVFGVENVMGLETKTAEPDNQFIDRCSHARKISQQPKGPLKTRMISVRLIFPKFFFCRFVDRQQIVFGLA
jgi:hypothetical protein